jgi:hypothetical protein
MQEAAKTLKVEHKVSHFPELGSVVTVETRWSLEVMFPSRAVFSLAARQSHNPSRNLLEYHR